MVQGTSVIFLPKHPSGKIIKSTCIILYKRTKITLIEHNSGIDFPALKINNLTSHSWLCNSRRLLLSCDKTILLTLSLNDLLIGYMKFNIHSISEDSSHIILTYIYFLFTLQPTFESKHLFL